MDGQTKNKTLLTSNKVSRVLFLVYTKCFEQTESLNLSTQRVKVKLL
jgi:hypothetical protein